MAGAGLFLWIPTDNGEKERMLGRLMETFRKLGVETFGLDITSDGAFGELEKIDRYFLSLPPDRKRFVFSLDGDGFCLTLRMDGLWVDNVQYNVFTYLTGHPREFQRELAGINSWYISILNSREEGVDFIQEQYPHLDGIEYMEWPGEFGSGRDGAREEFAVFARKILDRCK